MPLTYTIAEDSIKVVLTEANTEVQLTIKIYLMMVII